MTNDPTNREILDTLVEFSHAVGARFDRVESTLAVHGRMLESHGLRLDSIDRRLSRIEERVEVLEQK